MAPSAKVWSSTNAPAAIIHATRQRGGPAETPARREQDRPRGGPKNLRLPPERPAGLPTGSASASPQDHCGLCGEAPFKGLKPPQRGGGGGGLQVGDHRASLGPPKRAITGQRTSPTAVLWGKLIRSDKTVDRKRGQCQTPPCPAKYSLPPGWQPEVAGDSSNRQRWPA